MEQLLILLLFHVGPTPNYSSIVLGSFSSFTTFRTVVLLLILFLPQHGSTGNLSSHAPWSFYLIFFSPLWSCFCFLLLHYDPALNSSILKYGPATIICSASLLLILLILHCGLTRYASSPAPLAYSQILFSCTLVLLLLLSILYLLSWSWFFFSLTVVLLLLLLSCAMVRLLILLLVYSGPAPTSSTHTYKSCSWFSFSCKYFWSLIFSFCTLIWSKYFPSSTTVLRFHHFHLAPCIPQAKATAPTRPSCPVRAACSTAACGGLVTTGAV